MDLGGKFAIVTGASSGIGRAIALALASEGMGLSLIGRDLSRLQSVGAIARESSPDVTVNSVDLTRAEQVEAYVEKLSGRTVVALVHCAGLYERGRHEQRPRDAYATLFAANIEAPLHLTKLLLPALRQAQGNVVFVNSTQGLRSSPEVGLFAATQHALKAMADSLRDEVNAEGIRVLTVHVGRTATPRMERIFAMEGRRYTPERLLQPEDVAAIVLATMRLPRTAEVTNLTIRPMVKS